MSEKLETDQKQSSSSLDPRASTPHAPMLGCVWKRTFLWRVGQLVRGHGPCLHPEGESIRVSATWVHSSHTSWGLRSRIWAPRLKLLIMCFVP